MDCVKLKFSIKGAKRAQQSSDTFFFLLAVVLNRTATDNMHPHPTSTLHCLCFEVRRVCVVGVRALVSSHTAYSYLFSPVP